MLILVYARKSFHVATPAHISALLTPRTDISDLSSRLKTSNYSYHALISRSQCLSSSRQ